MFSLDRCSVSSRKVPILWSYLDITLLFSSYVYLISLHLYLLVVYISSKPFQTSVPIVCSLVSHWNCKLVGKNGSNLKMAKPIQIPLRPSHFWSKLEDSFSLSWFSFQRHNGLKSSLTSSSWFLFDVSLFLILT